ncbi:MAG: beta-ketoacyl-[acyl-carrier-protein] synthase II [Nitrospiraceae bacterium]|nr:MAG: beta-ketoacyl-[acyl-carrier-protein] synthase II [Nitrospiraceae bacterium]
MRRVVITGLGAVTPLGNDIETTWDNLTKSISGIGHITRFDPAGLSSRIAGEAKNFSPEDYISRKDVQRLDPFIHYAVAAATMALEDAGLIRQGPGARGKRQDEENFVTCHLSLEKAGIVIGSSRGGISTLEQALIRTQTGVSRFSAYLMSSTTISMAASFISIKFGIKGTSLGISTACASGANAIGEAAKMVRHGETDIAVAGGAEAPVCRLAVGGYAASGALSGRDHEPRKASRPFDRDRDGFVISEGAGILVLEELGHALKRDARIYAELAGYGTSSDAYHQTKPGSEGESAAMLAALADAGVAPEEIDYINAHATSTIPGDAAEAEAVRKVFGKRAHDVPVSSCKSMLGHMLGAAGAVEAAITALSIHRGTIVPTLNLENPGPACDLGHVTSVTEKKINAALTNSFGFGGVNAALALKKFTP